MTEETATNPVDGGDVLPETEVDALDNQEIETTDEADQGEQTDESASAEPDEEEVEYEGATGDALGVLERRGLLIRLDARVPGVDVLLAAIDVIVVPETFSCAYTGEASPGRAIARLGAAFPDALIIATLGERGSLALDDGPERLPVAAQHGVDEGPILGLAAIRGCDQ